MNDTPGRLEIPEALWQVMLNHMRACLPEESCGLLGGRAHDGVLIAHTLLVVENELHSPVRFRMAPTGLLEALNMLDRGGLDLVAFFHSHPSGPDHPSPTDLAEFAYPGVLALIGSPLPGAPDGWQVRAFRIDGVLDPQARAHEVALRRVPNDTATPDLSSQEHP